MTTPRWLLLAMVLAVTLQFPGPAATAGTPEGMAADYEQLTGWEFSSREVALPPDGVKLVSETAEWYFSAGTVRLMRPMSDGMVTGLVFEGPGFCRITIPDPVEVGQLGRFGVRKHGPDDRDDAPRFEFRRVVLRTTDPRVIDSFPVDRGFGYEKDKRARQRHRWWLEHARFDADARVLAGLLNGDGEYLAVDMETNEHGWLFYEFDPWRMEEIRLCRMRKTNDFVEVWVSLDRETDRRPDGRPGNERRPFVDLVHADLDVDLMKHKGRAGKEISRGGNWEREYPDTGFRARMTFESLRDGLRALPLRLNPWSNDVTAVDANGRPLQVLRAPIGQRFAKVHPREEDMSLVVLLEKPLARGETTTIEFAWQRRCGNSPARGSASEQGSGSQNRYPTVNHQGDRCWYPEPLESSHDRHTIRLTVVHPEALEVRATGDLTGGSGEGKSWTATWIADTPIRGTSYLYGHGFKGHRIQLDGLPEVIGFGPDRVQKIGNTVEAVAAHMADSIRFFQETFDFPLPLETVIGTRGVPGQDYAGHITYSSPTFDLDSAWRGEWYIALRTAELFWGGQIDWESYRDRWLVDALSAYSAIMYLEAASGDWGLVKRGPIKDYQELLRLRQRQLASATATRFKLLGPLDVGFRERIPGVTPPGYNRSKGLSVLHMLNGMLGDRFEPVLATFLRTHAGGSASTRDFIAMVEQETGEDWGWFFHQWVYNTGVPAYEWTHTLAEAPDADGLYQLDISMTQADVPEGFRMPVTFGLEYGAANEERLTFEMDQPSKTHTVRLPRRPVKVTFDPEHFLLYVKE